MAAEQGQTVLFHYEGRLDDGTVIDSSVEHGPLEVTIGKHVVIPGVEEALIGMEPGETKTVTIAAERAYGPHRSELLQEVRRDVIPDGVDLTPGNRLAGHDAEGHRVEVTVVSTDGDTVTLDANHWLAGRALTFDLALVEIR